MNQAFEVPPNAVRVWRGYRAASPLPTAQADFLSKLGTVFVPATVEMQVKIGLDGYIPSVPAGLPDKPDTVPDETAILFWDSQQTYTDGFKTLAVRTYTLTHNAVYRPPSGADFPTLFAGTITSEHPCYLIDKPADWMKGNVQHLAGSRPDAVPPDSFRAQIASALTQIQKKGAVSGAIACAGDNYLVYWELIGASGASGIDSLTTLLGWSRRITPKPTGLEKGLWDVWPGMTINSGDGFNMQFKRRWEP
jgi:hypothetical protein